MDAPAGPSPLHPGSNRNGGPRRFGQVLSRTGQRHGRSPRSDPAVSGHSGPVSRVRGSSRFAGASFAPGIPVGEKQHGPLPVRMHALSPVLARSGGISGVRRRLVLAVRPFGWIVAVAPEHHRHGDPRRALDDQSVARRPRKSVAQRGSLSCRPPGERHSDPRLAARTGQLALGNLSGHRRSGSDH